MNWRESENFIAQSNLVCREDSWEGGDADSTPLRKRKDLNIVP